MRDFLKSPLYVTLAIVLLGVVTQALQAFDHVYWNVWFKNRAQTAETSAVIVSLDNGAPLSPTSVSGSTARQAQLVDRLVAAGAKQVYLDMPVVGGEDPAGDSALGQSLAKAGSHVTLVWRSTANPSWNRSDPISYRFDPPAGTKLAISSWNVNFLGFAEEAYAANEAAGRMLPLVSVAELEGVKPAQIIYPDFGFRPESVPVFEAADVLRGAIAPDRIAGHRVFVTSTYRDSGSALGYFGFGSLKVPAALVDIAGYKGYTKRSALNIGWFPLLAFCALMISLGHRTRSRRGKVLIYTSLVLASILVPGLLRERNVISSVAPAFAAMLIYAPLRSSQKWRNRVQLTSSASGLPNIAAMAAEGISRSQDVIAVSVSQYEQMLASLPRELHGECARQIARRLSLGAGDRQVYDNDNGHFVWLENSKTIDALVAHLDGLRALFSSPLVIGGHVLDTTVHFGVDRNMDIKPISRIQSALASANEAQAKGKLYEEIGEERLAESPWELSLHARIDEGLRSGAIWLALQPQYDFRTGRISGAEALIRWNDPERGVIPPDAFILQAERAGRIEAITYWVLERAIEMLARINAVAAPFQISVNLSARMVDHPSLIHRVADIVREHDLKDCSQITFEVTETFSMANREEAKRNLAALRAMGFRLSIDDFGTGQASLAYLAEIPSDEIKLDRRFIQPITIDRRERLIVESVIKLAHSLGQEVVAEGIEDVMTLEALRELGCDLAQGYHVGRPMTVHDLMDLLGSHEVSRRDWVESNV